MTSPFAIFARRMLRRSLTLLLLLSLGACAIKANNRSVNQPMTAEFAAHVQQGRLPIAGESVIALSLSGGGVRAAAFGLGALQALAGAPGEADVFDDLSFISSVSGGSLTAAYTGLYGRAVLQDFRQQVLYRDLEQDMRRSLWSPANLLRLAGGGVNDLSNMAHILDRDIFHGATFADLYRRQRPEIWINASDVYNRTPFPFIPAVFDALCSDLSQLPLSEAVAASMAVPLVFAPIVLKTYPEDCSAPLPDWMFDNQQLRQLPALTRAFAAAARNYRNPQRMRYIKLVDGGVTDNNGLASILLVNSMRPNAYGPFTHEEAIRLKRLLFLVVDAGRPVSGEWAKQAEGPSAFDLSLATTDTATDSATRTAMDAFFAMVNNLRQRLVTQRCQLTRAEIERVLGAHAQWRCDELEMTVGAVGFDDLDGALAERLRNMPTRLSLPKEDIDAAIAAGQSAVQRHPAFQRYRAQRLGQQAGTP
ncbi:patatin-like phospholipase family protein [Massilia sp. W12]|uniref:patatin-like phospholipase family protein n=1 Tax=Massilia sp. W12 TaxID=3126507 RepID=UPI0030CAACBC